MKTIVSLEFTSPGDAARWLSLHGGDVGNAPGAAAPPPAHTPPPPNTTVGTTAPPPPNSAPSGVPPAALVPPPAAAPPPPAPNGAVGVPQVLAAMAEYSKTHKAAGVKNVLAQCRLAKVTEANAEQLVWLKQAFESNAAYPAAA